MDPYLEAPGLWHGLHARLLTHISETLQSQLAPHCVAMIEKRVLLGPPDGGVWPGDEPGERQRGRREAVAAVAVRPRPEGTAIPEIIDVPGLFITHRWIAIREAGSKRLITAVEVFAPWVKSGQVRESYSRQREPLLHSDVSLVEIDLLRAGQHTVAVGESVLRPSDYRVCVHRPGSRYFELVRFGVREPLPTIAIPLAHGLSDVVLRLAAVFRQCYDAGPYAYAVDYAAEPDSPLDGEDAVWARERVGHWQAENGLTQAES
jgi:hypothetical protein